LDQSFQRYEVNVEKNTASRNVKESFNKFLDPEPKADDFQDRP